MSTRADIIDLLDNATEESLEKILDAAKKILRDEKGDKVYTLEEIKEKAIPIAKKYGVKKLSLFGSYARGDANADSDLDFLYNGKKDESLSDYVDLIYALEKEFKCHVDLIDEGSTRGKNFFADVKNDEVILYAG